MGYFEELQAKINQLENDVNGKNLELQLIESEMVSCLEPSVALSQTSELLIQMLSELFAYRLKNKPNDKLKASEDRLKQLLAHNSVLDRIATDNYKLKINNRMLHHHYQLLRIKNRELQTELTKIKKAHEEL